MQIGLYVDKRTNEVLYFGQKTEDGEFWFATSSHGEHVIHVNEEPNYKPIDYFQAKNIKEELKGRIRWLEQLLASKFTGDGEFKPSERLRQINTLDINQSAETKPKPK